RGAVGVPGGSGGSRRELALHYRRLGRGGERLARAEDEHLDRRRRELELVRDLAIGKPTPLPENDRPALVQRHRLERLLEPDQLLAVLAMRSSHRLLRDLERIRGFRQMPASLAGVALV